MTWHLLLVPLKGAPRPMWRKGPQTPRLRRLMSRTIEGRDALRASQAHPQARSIASAGRAEPKMSSYWRPLPKT
jgi:hypothetical protein